MTTDTKVADLPASESLSDVLREMRSDPHPSRRWVHVLADRIEAALARQDAQAIPEGLEDRIEAAIKRIVDGHAPRRIPADPTDVDLVLAEVLALIRGSWPPFWIKPQPVDRTTHTENQMKIKNEWLAYGRLADGTLGIGETRFPLYGTKEQAQEYADEMMVKFNSDSRSQGNRMVRAWAQKITGDIILAPVEPPAV